MEETPRQIRQTEDGGAEIWDNILQDWRPVMALDRVDTKKTAKPNPDRGDDEWFVCPDCGEDVNVLNNIGGWELRRICPISGDYDDLVEDEITHVDMERYECAEGCGWQGYTDWFNDVVRRKTEPQRLPKPEIGVGFTGFDFNQPADVNEPKLDLWPDFKFTDAQIKVQKWPEEAPKETGEINITWPNTNIFKFDAE